MKGLEDGSLATSTQADCSELFVPVVLDSNLLTLDKTLSGLQLDFAAIATYTIVSFEAICSYALKILCFSFFYSLPKVSKLLSFDYTLFKKSSRFRPVRNSSNHPAEMIGPG